MEKEQVLKDSRKLVEESQFVMVGSNAGDGFPNIKAMFNVETEGLKTVWLSTNTSSMRVSQFIADPRACLYYVDTAGFRGLMLTGVIEILTDHNSRSRLWQDGCERYYPLGVDDPDYSVLKFTARRGDYYQGLEKLIFEV